MPPREGQSQSGQRGSHLLSSRGSPRGGGKEEEENFVQGKGEGKKPFSLCSLLLSLSLPHLSLSLLFQQCAALSCAFSSMPALTSEYKTGANSASHLTNSLSCSLRRLRRLLHLFYHLQQKWCSLSPPRPPSPPPSRSAPRPPSPRPSVCESFALLFISMRDRGRDRRGRGARGGAEVEGKVELIEPRTV